MKILKKILQVTAIIAAVTTLNANPSQAKGTSLFSVFVTFASNAKFDAYAVKNLGMKGNASFNFRQCVNQSYHYVNENGQLISGAIFLKLLGGCNDLNDLVYDMQKTFCHGVGRHQDARANWHSRPGRTHLTNQYGTVKASNRSRNVYYGIGRCWYKRHIPAGVSVRCDDRNFGDPRRSAHKIRFKWVDIHGRSQNRNETIQHAYNELNMKVTCRY